MKTRLLHLYSAICILYAVAILAYVITRTLFGDSFALIGLIANIMPVPILPALILLPLALILRRWRALIALIPVIAIGAWLYADYFLPPTPTIRADEALRRQIRLLTFNTFAKQTDIDDTFDVIAASDADVILLQELNVHLTERIADELYVEYPYQFLRPRGISVTGMGIISRFPLEAGRYWREGHDRWGMQYAWIDADGTRIALFNMHAMSPFAEATRVYDLTRRAADIDILMGWLDANAGHPAITAGDFNLTDQTEHYARITERLIDAHRAAGWGFAPTFPNFNRSTYDVAPPMRWIPPLIRIDYIFHTPDIRPLEVTTLSTTGASDHYPVLAILEIPLPPLLGQG